MQTVKNLWRDHLRRAAIIQPAFSPMEPSHTVVAAVPLSIMRACTATVTGPPDAGTEARDTDTSEITGGTPAAGHPGHGVYACPSGETHPDLWMLGSSDYGAQLAAHLG